ncbi:MAG: glycyl-radical enzyme activating protein [Clostridia bacterium]|nr:glycyl-radical enzyme activating protein [Clostridia bacterium]
MSTDKKLIVTEIQRFCMHDGPGVRTTVFLKGCPLRCAWCHNPETQKGRAELLFYQNKCVSCGACAAFCPVSAQKTGAERRIDRDRCISCFACAENCPTGALVMCGKEMSVEEIVEVVQKDSAFYGKDGGVTLSGGEPFAQGEATLALLRACKTRGLTTAVETCGYADGTLLRRASPLTDLFLWDIKDTDEARHMQYTGVSHRAIYENLRAVNETGARIRLRCILVNGVNTDRKHYGRLAEIARYIRHFDGLEILAYHAYGGTKSVFLGLKDNGRVDWIPSEQQVLEAKECLRSSGIRVL